MSKNLTQPADFGVVVLNYSDHESTIACVNSLIVCDPAPRRIIVVDNDSPNDSLNILQTTLAHLETVEVITSGFNGGYSFGNNVGIRRLRADGFKHVIIATSDTLVQTADILTRMAGAITPTTGVIAPQIISAGVFDNPCHERLKLRYLLDLLWLRRGLPLLNVRRRIGYLVRKIVPRKRRVVPTAHGVSVSDELPRQVYMLHGAFMCLTDRYLSEVGELDEDIFMFGEEDLLASLCLKHDLMQVLVPAVTVLHAHDSSVNLSWGQKADQFVDQETRKSWLTLRRKISMLPLLRGWLRGYPSRSVDAS